MLQCSDLSKEFKIYKKSPGLQASIQAFFNRKYSINKAVENFNLSVETPQLIGLLGPNGSGKTTLMKMFTGIITPSSGSVQVLNRTPSHRENDFKKNISLVMGQKSQLWWDIPVMDSFLLFQKYYEIDESKFKKKLYHLSERLQTSHLMEIPVRKLSLGERMKMELIACLLHEPKVIFLDEPTIGLDVVSQKNVRQFLKEYHQEKKPLIILTSHYMADVEALCEKIVLIIKGKKWFDGHVQDFKKQFKKEKTIVFNFQKPVQSQDDSEWAKSTHHLWSKDRLQLKIRSPESQIKELTIKILNSYPVADFHTEKVSIEEIMDEILSNPNLIKN